MEKSCGKYWYVLSDGADTEAKISLNPVSVMFNSKSAGDALSAELAGKSEDDPLLYIETFFFSNREALMGG